MLKLDNTPIARTLSQSIVIFPAENFSHFSGHTFITLFPLFNSVS